MKYMVASDIHGSEHFCEKMIESFKAEGCDRLILLGDILYHGPRNDLTFRYNPKAVITMLNGMAQKITAVKGNCDAEVDDFVLDFDLSNHFYYMEFDGKSLVFTHGHRGFNEDRGSYVFSGHTHIPLCKEIDGVTYLNPGSTSIPKGGSQGGYIVFDSDKIVRKDFDGNETFSVEW